jgi:hypothetical protein
MRSDATEGEYGVTEVETAPGVHPAKARPRSAPGLGVQSEPDKNLMISRARAGARCMRLRATGRPIRVSLAGAP